MNISQASKNWAELGEADPMWAILTDDQKRGRKWQREEFFATGRQEIEASLKSVVDAGVTLNPGLALDFGCGLGRLTQALANHFQKVDGVDVSTSMVRQAREYNTHGSAVEYHVNCKTDLSLFPKERFDFVYSNIVLQHIPPSHQLSYIAGFMDVLKVGGFAYFQTVHSHGWRALCPDWMIEQYRNLKSRGKAYIPMYGVNPGAVEKTVKENGGELVRKELINYDGWESRYLVDKFLVVKRRARN
jgi:2-polyprenyl-3-methyl-5-hydroxy-6-metoxy-1,4-benzoquinol methylase